MVYGKQNFYLRLTYSVIRWQALLNCSQVSFLPGTRLAIKLLKVVLPMKMRSRIIQPGFFKNEYLAEYDFTTRILFQGLWLLADREGKLEYRPKQIRAEIFPHDDVDVIKMIENNLSPHFIILYSINKTNYIKIINFEKHQSIHWNESESLIPEPQEDSLIDPCRSLDSPLQVSKGISKRRSKSKGKSNGGDEIVREVTDYFCELFLKTTGNKYDFTKKDGVLFAQLIKKYEVEKVKQIIYMFFCSNDSFIQEAGYTVGVLKSQINKLLSKEYKPLDNRSEQQKRNDEVFARVIKKDQEEG